MKKLIAIFLAVTCLAVALTACGTNEPKDNNPSTITIEDMNAVPTQEEVKEETKVEDNKTKENAGIQVKEKEQKAVDIVIDYGDVASIEALAKQAQNFEISEGTVASISGVFSKGVMTPAVQEEKEDGSFVGISMMVDGDWEMPEDGTDIEVTGEFVKGNFYMEFHVSPENIIIK